MSKPVTDDPADRSAVEPSAGFGARLRQLQRCTTVSALLAKSADVVRTTGGFDRAIALAVEGETLTAKACGPLDDDASDLLRRTLLRTLISVEPRSREGRWLRLGVDGPAAPRGAPSTLEGAGLELGHVAIGPVAPEGELLAVIVGCNQEPIDAIGLATVEATAELAAIALSRLVMTARLREATEALRSLSMSTEALIDEILRAPVQIPSEGAAGPVFPFHQRQARDVDRARDVLTDREIEVAALLVEGRSDREIAEALVISVNTAKDHVSRLRRKLQAGNRVQAAAKYLQLTQR